MLNCYCAFKADVLDELLLVVFQRRPVAEVSRIGFCYLLFFFSRASEIVFGTADVRHCHLTVTPIVHCSEKVTS